jgi:hypothetical protein
MNQSVFINLTRLHGADLPPGENAAGYWLNRSEKLQMEDINENEN